MTEPKSYTGRTRQRRTKWTVRAADRAAHALIVCGGIGTIVAVSMVCVFLLWVVLPLFESGEIQPAARLDTLRPSGVPWHVALGEHQVAGWALYPDSTLEVFSVVPDQAGQPLSRQKLFDAPAMTSAAFFLTDDRVAFGLSDGTVRLGRIGFRTSFVPDSQLDDALQRLEPGQVAAEAGGLIERTPSGQFRRQTLAAELGPPIEVGSTSAIEQLDFSDRSSGLALVTLSADGVLRFSTVKAVRDLETDEVTHKVRSIELPRSDGDRATKAMRVLVSGVGDNVFAAWRDGRLLRYDVSNLTHAGLVEDIDLVPETDRELTSLEMMIGKVTLVAGDSQGRIRGWFRIRGGAGDESADSAGDGARRSGAGDAEPAVDHGRLVAAHELPGAGVVVSALAPSPRSRMLASGYADGTVRLFYLTNDAALLASRIPGEQPIGTLSIAPKENGLIASARDGLCRWQFDVPHPEVTLASLFLPVWYEGYPRPSHEWQSSGGTDNFEPKLGLTKLIFGTFKATLYSLLFGVPLALLAAIYTSEFLHKTTRARIKPTIELMASLPSVVLGFIAALVLAPLVEGWVPVVLASLLTVPLSLLVGAVLWQWLPKPVRVRLEHWRFVCMCLVLPLGIWAATRLGPAVNRILFAGDIKAWLEGRVGTGTGGWLLLLVPLFGVGSAWLLATFVNPILRRKSASWTEGRAAAVEFIKFVLACGFALAGSLAVAKLLSLAGCDPRGTFIGPYEQLNALIVGFVMGFAIIPIIFTIAEDALSTVPEHLRSASLGAGATRWQTATRIIIPTAMSGLFSAVMVGLGRAVGETMIVLMAAGNTPVMDWNIFNGFRTLSGNIAEELPEAAVNSTHYRTLFLAALVLFGLTFVLNTVAESVRQRFRKRAFQL